MLLEQSHLRLLLVWNKNNTNAFHLNYKQCIENAGERQRQIQDLQAANAGLTSENNLLRDQNGALKSSLEQLVCQTQEKVLLILIN